MKKKLLVLLVLALSVVLFSGLCSNAMTQSEFNSKITTQKALYPHGSRWTSSFDGGIQCFGFAHMLAYNVFGTKAKTWTKVYSLNNVKAGDVVQFGNTSGSGHTVFVLSVSGDNVTYADCNSDYNCTVKWGNTFSKKANKIWSYSFSYLYSAPTITSYTSVPQTPTIKNVSVSGSNVSVSWNAVEQTEKYVVDFWDPNGTHNYFSTEDTHITKTLPTAQYGIRICAENTLGTSGFSNFYYVYVGDYLVSFDANGGELERTKAKIAYDSINGIRGEDQLVIYNNSGTSTGTNMYGIEVLIQYNRVVDIINRGESATVPTNGFVLSAHREKHYWIEENVSIGDYVNYHGNTQDVWIWSKNGWLTWTKSVEIGKTYGELPVPLNREGYIFKGWYTAADGGEKVTESSKVEAQEEYILYAHWEKITPYTVSTVVKNGSSYIVNIETYNFEEDCDILVVGYKNNKCSAVKKIPYSENIEPCVISADIDEIKVMAWGKDSDIMPLCNAEVIPESEWIIE